MNTNTNSSPGPERTALTVVPEIASGCVKVDAFERRRVMLMAQGEARCGTDHCPFCPHWDGCDDCLLGRLEPMNCPAVAAAWAAGARA